MRRQILLASVGAIAIAGSAYAADLPYRGPPPVYLPPPPIFTWTGIYIGGQVGYAWGRDNVNLAGPFGPPDADGDDFFDSAFSFSPKGVIGGAHVGYNLQIPSWNWFSSSGVVIGLEGSVDGTSQRTTQLVGAFPPFFQGLVDVKTPVQGSIRARLGLAWDRVLIYATGGAAFEDLTIAYNTLPLGGLDQITSTRSGWTVGGGLDYAITNNWSIGGEYRYSDFGSRNDFSPIALFPNSFVRHHLTEHQVQARFSYKFDTLAPAPVVAKY
jgi:outer membrane immunogenic protein